jgi:TonB family protein
MTGQRLASLLVLLAALWSVGPGLHAQVPTRGLESFFVTFTDYRILHVRPVASGVSVRSIQMHYLEESCWTRVMRAYEVTLPSTTVQQLAATPICALTQARIDAALEKSRENFIRARYGIPWGTYFDSVVGVCDGQERRLIFDYDGKNAGKPGIDEKKLRRVDAAVHALWTMGNRIASRVSPLAPTEATQEEQGTAAAADLIAGRYDAAFADACWDQHRAGATCKPSFWSQVIGTYDGPPQQRGPLPVEMIDRESFKFTHYVSPEFPSIAMSARILRDVKVRLSVDGGSGAVSEASIVDGHPLLDDAALRAAKEWRFVAGTTPGTPFTITLRFDVKCAPQ